MEEEEEREMEMLGFEANIGFNFFIESKSGRCVLFIFNRVCHVKSYK
jgi:hypothetical protein